jgi:N-acetylgalactosamine-N,N'-diacetylbacillosaminyl-diphospho-undecaprenol 4-alpha-N-acetylgalactosaminyltransferase
MAWKPHIVFVINSLAGGGAEKALVNIIGGLRTAMRDCRVTLVLLDQDIEACRPPAFVEKVVLDNRGHFASSLFSLTRALARLKPDVVVSFLARANCANVFASKILGFPAIVSERVHTTSHFGSSRSIAVQSAVLGFFYRRADRIIAVSAGVERDLVANFGVAPERICVIHNPIDVARLERLSQEETDALPCPAPYVLAIGRMTLNKNFAMTLRGYAASSETAPLVILGEGPERAALQKLAADLGLAGRVFMPGYLANPFPALARAKYLVSSSNAEGFPNVIVEAMALGLPVIAADCLTGPAELLSPHLAPTPDGVTRAAHGLLVPVGKPDLLADAINLLQDDRLIAEFSAKGRPRAAHYRPTRICQRYWQVIEAQLPSRTPLCCPADANSPARKGAAR